GLSAFKGKLFSNKLHFYRKRINVYSVLGVEGKGVFRYYFIALIVLGIDQWTKWLIIKKMDLYESFPIIENLFYITSHRNKGAAWGILQDQMIFFYIVTIIAVVGIVYVMQKHAKGQRL